MEKIKTVWFDADRIYMKTQEGKVYSRPLEAYPDLKWRGYQMGELGC